MKSFIFCTSYFGNDEMFRKRYLKWINYYTNHPFTNNKNIFINDDGSDLNCMIDSRVSIHDADAHARWGTFPELNSKINLFTHAERKKAPETAIYAHAEGWWRSVSLALKIAKKYNFEKIIHLESDAYLVSKRMFEYVDSLNQGWTSMFCPKYGVPESSIQIICKDQFESFESLVSCGYQELAKKQVCAENLIPFTHVETSLVGDRYGEVMDTEKYMDQPPNIDYFCQVHPDTNVIAE